MTSFLPSPITGELVALPIDDTSIDGLWYPAQGVTRQAAMLMHGNGANFYSGPVRFLAPPLVERGIACFAFNRRGHETLTTRTRAPEGNAYQTAAQAMADNECARAYVATRGFASPVVVGHSNGGLFAARHVADHPGAEALVLVSAHSGGPEMLRRGSELGLLAQDQGPALSAEAHRLVDSGRPDALMLMPGWWYVISAAAYLDMERNPPRILEAAARITCPVLYLRGGLEDAELYPAEAFAEACPAPVEVRIIPGADHFYAGCEEATGKLVAEWVADVLGTDARPDVS